MMRSTATVVLALFSTASLAQDEHRHHEAHEHGVTQMNLAIDGDTLLIELKSPAADIVGFEHAPENAAQQATLRQALQTLEQGDRLFQFDPGAGCSLRQAAVESGLAPEEEAGHAHEREHEADSHSEFEVAYTFQCRQIGKLSSVTVKWFEVFGSAESMQVQLITPIRQGALELDRHHPRIEF